MRRLKEEMGEEWNLVFCIFYLVSYGMFDDIRYGVYCS